MFNRNYLVLSLIFIPSVLLFAEMRTKPETTHESLNNFFLTDIVSPLYVNLQFPGLNYGDTLQKAISLGYSEFATSDTSYPETRLDVNQSKQISPFISIRMPIKQISSGIYLGNAIVNTNEFNRNQSSADTLKHLRHEQTALSGGVWATFNNKTIKGLSLFVKGCYTHRNVGFQKSEEWKSLNTSYVDKSKSGYGALSALLAINEEHLICPRFEYGNNSTSSINSIADTLFFSNEVFITDQQRNDCKVKNQLLGVQLDYLFKPKSARWLWGVNLYANRSLLDFTTSKGDSSEFVQELFIQRKIMFDSFELNFGSHLINNAVFYSRSNSYLGYYDILKTYRRSKCSDYFTLKIPFLLLYKYRKSFEFFTGTCFKYQSYSSNYSFLSDSRIKTQISNYSFDYIPFGIQYNTRKSFSFKLEPSYENKLFIGNFEITYQL